MPTGYLHDRPDFPDLLRILENETSIQSYLIEKDYWIMHVLYPTLTDTSFEPLT
jgi:hypothetical protein